MYYLNFNTCTVFGAKQTMERHIVSCLRKKFKKEKTDSALNLTKNNTNIMDFCKVEMNPEPSGSDEEILTNTFQKKLKKIPKIIDKEVLKIHDRTTNIMEFCKVEMTESDSEGELNQYEESNSN